jgi:hypothetical protein
MGNTAGRKKKPCSWQIPPPDTTQVIFFSSTYSPQKNSTANGLQNDTLCDTFHLSISGLIPHCLINHFLKYQYGVAFFSSGEIALYLATSQIFEKLLSSFVIVIFLHDPSPISVVGVCNLILQKVHQSIHHQNLFRLKIQIF